MKTLAPILLVSLICTLLAPANVPADGIFVAPKFVWDKHKDINEPTQKAIIVYDGGEEDLILQVKYEGPVDEFGWLIPVPNLPTVKEGSMKCFYELSQFTQQRFTPPWQMSGRATRGIMGDLSASSAGGLSAPPPVKVIETKTVGAYEVAVLSATESGALKKWLEDNHFYLPEDKSDVIDSYVKQQWYFIAVRINLSKSAGFQLLSTSRKSFVDNSTQMKLAEGELNPLQISFASDRCIFPLKISSINGGPSEVQVYVLSPEPLLEAGMLEKKLPLIYSNDMARAKQSAAQMEQWEMNNRNNQARFMGGMGSVNAPSLAEMQRAIQQQSEQPVANPDDLLPYAKVAGADLPDCSEWIPRLAGKSWWLTKQTWTFQPKDMRDLVFESALLFFAGELGTKYGYFAADSLNSFDADAAPAFISAFQSTNPAVRITVASIINRHYGYPRDPNLTAAALGLLADSEPQVRMAGVEILTDYGGWNTNNAKTVIAMLRDPDPGVRHAAIFALPRYSDDLYPYLFEFEQMLDDPNPDVQFSGIQMLQRLGYGIPRDNLVALFKSTNPEVLGTAYSQLRRQGDKLSDDEALVLLQNSESTARICGLYALSQNPEKQSVELALPFLKDPDEMVRLKAADVLQMLTGQQFNEDQPDEWIKWWDENKESYVFPKGNQAFEPDPNEGRADHDRGCVDYDAQKFTDALADFRKACELGSDVTDYSACRLWLVQVRLGQRDEAAKELAVYLARRTGNPGDWSSKIARFLLGQVTETDLMSASATAGVETPDQQLCEAYFYIGSKYLLDGNKAAARDDFKKSVATNVTSFQEYQSSQVELANLSALGAP